jgi:oligopeptide/dipeptide ABC transporter ATP-binding protein
MYVGKIMEMAETDALLRNPLHPYTEALLSAIPPADPTVIQERIKLQGEVPSPANPPSGCIFHPRCAYAKDQCKTEIPALNEAMPGRFVACHFAKELKLKGIGG